MSSPLHQAPEHFFDPDSRFASSGSTRGSSPVRVDNDHPALGRKFDSDKPRFDLLLQGVPNALEEVTKVLTYGSHKYADHNWRHVEHAETRYLAAGTRHELAVARGESRDPETNLHHLAHKLCCDLFRLELALTRT